MSAVLHTRKSHRRDRTGWLLGNVGGSPTPGNHTVETALAVSGETQVLRALWASCAMDRLVRLGYGVYARAIISRLSASRCLEPYGLRGAARER